MGGVGTVLEILMMLYRIVIRWMNIEDGRTGYIDSGFDPADKMMISYDR
jgi:hypothetical protein